MSWIDDIWEEDIKGFDFRQNIKDLGGAIEHHVKAHFIIDPSDRLDEFFAANWHWTQAHPGVQETADYVKNELGINPAESSAEIASVVGTVFGLTTGPIGGAIAGAATGWGIQSQFGTEEQGTEAAQAAGRGAVSGFISGYGAQASKVAAAKETAIGAEASNSVAGSDTIANIIAIEEASATTLGISNALIDKVIAGSEVVEAVVGNVQQAEASAVAEQEAADEDMTIKQIIMGERSKQKSTIVKNSYLKILGEIFGYNESEYQEAMAKWEDARTTVKTLATIR